MAKKSAAQIRRLQARAKARGETYIHPSPTANENNESRPNDEVSCHRMLLAAAAKLQDDMAQIAKDTALNAKERRSAKRKAEAIANEQLDQINYKGVTTTAELLNWFKKNEPSQVNQNDKSRGEKRKSSPAHSNSDDIVALDAATQSSSRHNPLIAFVGQLAYETTAADLLAHIQAELGGHDAFNITPGTCRIRLLTKSDIDESSRGMAFVQVDDPELLYALLKLHHSHLQGRRINVERSTGGRRGSTKRTEKIQALRNEQHQHVHNTVQRMLQSYYASGDLVPGELDDGVVALMQRHTPTVVAAALHEFVTKNGPGMDNPSAYLSFLLTKFGSEGLRDEISEKGKKRSTNTTSTPSSQQRQKQGPAGVGRDRNSSSVLATEHRVDMSAAAEFSNDTNASPKTTTTNKVQMSSIFTSWSSRGRGRGR